MDSNPDPSLVDDASAADTDGVESLEPCYVVGVGASAGGLEALEALFDCLPPDTGMAFVVVQHLSPDFKSLMDQLIRRHTEMAVFRVENGMPVRRNAIYLIPAGKEMIIAQGRLLLTDKDRSESMTLPIDHFFRSLAHDCGSRAIAIVLSGSGSDGSRGVREIHNMGGLVIAQDSATALFDSMPNSAEETGVVDITASPVEIVDSLLRLVQHPLQRAGQSANHPSIPEDGIKQILRVIRDTYGIDFTYYKPTTVMRRIERRLLLNHAADLEKYVGTVSSDSSELNQLYKDLLIGVTQFFRDTDAFSLIEDSILPDLLLRIPPQQEVRVWVAGCATGEEAYSLAILLHERLSIMNRPINVRIFATDVHRASLDFASTGVYPLSSVTGLSSSRLEQYFTVTRDGYKVSQDLRNMVVFAPHNLIKDAPFTRLDLVSCRNMMIYLQPLAQKKVLSLFHFALKTGGVLFLGPSETTGELADEFDVIDAQWRISRKRRDIRLPADLRLPGAVAAITPRQRQLTTARQSFPIRMLGGQKGHADRELLGVYDAILNEVMPAALLINESSELVHAFGDVAKLLRVPSGRASSNALDMLPADLRTLVIGAIQRVGVSGETATYSHITIETPEGPRDVTVSVKPITHRSSDSRYMLISMRLEVRPNRPGQQVAIPVVLDDVARERINVLEIDLRHTHESLQATIEELESSNEELQATNEEMVASNEELQSTNEELHSVNEELYTVNAEYQKKIGELTELTHDMDNLLKSTDVHTLFLDQNLCIRKFTPQIATEFNLIPADIGRRIEGFSHSIPCPELMQRLHDALDSGTRFEDELTTAGGDHFLLQILPYRGETNRSGVVLTLLDITESKVAETRFRATFDNAAVGMAHVDPDGRWLLVNDRLCSILGYTRDELQNRTFQDVTFADDLEHDLQQFGALKRGEIDRYTIEKRYVRKLGDLVWVSLTVSLQRDEHHQPVYAIVIVQDISRRKVFEGQLSQAVMQRDQFLATLSHELRNPLAAVRHSLALLQHDAASPEVYDRALETVGRQVGQMAHLLDDLLDVSRITQNKIHYHMRPLDLRVVVRDAIDAMRPSFADREQRLTVKLLDDPVPVLGDETRLLQVVENLLTNACKYTPAGGTIDVTLERMTDQCQLTVSDSGTGIAPELLDDVFNLFVQSEQGVSRRDGGMGLGLTLVRSLVEHHGGTIIASSEGPGRGSRFTVHLPLTDAFVPSKLSPFPIDPPAPQSSAGKQTRIVLVEDNDDARTMLQTLLELEGFHVDTAADGAIGLEKLLRLKPDVGLVDIGLPELDGYTVARRVRERFSSDDLWLIALTGYGQTTDVQKSEEAGFDSHLTKPIDPDELASILRSTGRRHLLR